MTTRRPDPIPLPSRGVEVPHKRQEPPSWASEPEEQRQERPEGHRNLTFLVSNGLGGVASHTMGRPPPPLGVSLIHAGSGDSRGGVPSQRSAVGGVVKVEGDTSLSSALPDEDLMVLRELLEDDVTPQSQPVARAQFGQYPPMLHSMEPVQAPGVQTQYSTSQYIYSVPPHQQHLSVDQQQVASSQYNHWHYNTDGLGVNRNNHM